MFKTSILHKAAGIYTGVDILYIFTLIATITIGATAICGALKEFEIFSTCIYSDMIAVYDDVLLVAANLGLSLLGLRIWLVSHYKSYPPTKNEALPTITVVIPAYNEGRQVLSTVRSVMASDYPPHKMDVICIDDGSQDDTWAWMKTSAEEFSTRIRLLRQPRNMGKRHALLAGFQSASGDVLVTLDSDSEILVDTLRNLVSPFALDERVGAVAGNVRVLNVDSGAIPKMLDVSFTLSFDFFRRAQSVYGGVLCTPGALSAYRATVISSFIANWANQTFLGKPANIGEDRALSNIVLKQGYRVVFQQKAVVLTVVPMAYPGLCRMFLRWARSNVRECLVMTQYIFSRFRNRDEGTWFLRLAGMVELLYLPLFEAVKVALALNLLVHPLTTMHWLIVACVVGAALPALNYQFRRPGLFGFKWALSYSFFWIAGLSWISFWGLMSAGRSGWLTRGLPAAPLTAGDPVSPIRTIDASGQEAPPITL